MKKILIYFILFFVFNVGNSFQAQAGTPGVLQYCIYTGQWSEMIKLESEFINNTQWCKIVKKSEDPDFYGQIFRASIRHRDNSGNLRWFIQTSKLGRIVDKHEASVSKYKKIEEDNLTKSKADEERKKVKKKKKPKKDKVSSSALTKELKELKKLYDDGILTEEEFTKAKKKILN